MTGRRPEILDRTVLSAGYLKLQRLRIRLSDAAVVDREIVSFGDAVAVLPYDPLRRCALTVRLFRPAVFAAGGGEALQEACAGMRGPDEAPADALRREATEELGLALGALEPVAEIWSNPGVSTERMALYLAAYTPADRRSPGGGAAGEHEGIEVLERPLARLAEQADSGRIGDPKLLILVQALRRARPELFVTTGDKAPAPSD